MLQNPPTSSCNKPIWTLRTGGELNELESCQRAAWCLEANQTTKGVFPDKTCVDSVNINKPAHLRAISGRKVNFSCTPYTLVRYSQLGGSSDFSK